MRVKEHPESKAEQDWAGGFFSLATFLFACALQGIVGTKKNGWNTNGLIYPIRDHGRASLAFEDFQNFRRPFYLRRRTIPLNS